MNLTVNRKIEPSAKAWLWRIALGPAAMADGLIETLSFSFLGLGLKLTAAKNLAKARHLAATRSPK